MAEVDPRDACPSDEDRLYDEYLEACLRGEAPPPGAFLAGREGLGASLLLRLERFRKVLELARRV